MTQVQPSIILLTLALRDLVTNLFSAPSSTFTPLGAEKTWERVFYMWNNKLTGNKNLSREKILMIVTYGFFAFVNMFFFTDIIRQSTIRKYDLFAINSPVLYPFVIGVLMAVCFVISLISEFKGNKTTVTVEKNIEKIKTSEDRTENAKDVSTEKYSGKQLLMILLLFVYLFIYTFLIKELSFLITTPFFLFVFMFLLSDVRPTLKRVLFSGAASLVMTFTLYFVFSSIFKVLLP